MKRNKYFGVIEGFYRRPYSFLDRCDLIGFLADIGMNAYVYAPKMDPFHRGKYKLLYPAAKLKEFERLNEIAKKNRVSFNYALAPGKAPDQNAITRKIMSMFDIGIRHFSLLFDDINITLNIKSAQKQAGIANNLYDILKKKDRDAVLLFCPTQYRGFKRTDYISAIAADLNRNIRVFWTGPRVISLRITKKQLEMIAKILDRPPLIWDNLFANDYIPPGTILRFPYRGRDPEIMDKASGIMLNPMNEYRESKPLIHTAASFIRDPGHYRPRTEWKKAERLFS